MFKRTFDVTAAAVLLLLTLPVLAIAAILIKVDSDGPVIFRQWRMGRRFNRFRLYKLRTMHLGGDGPAYTLGAHPRITHVGRWLRWSKLDEVPQLWNVVRGEMSLVGPRPVIPELAMEFDTDYARLLQARPGLTDPASLRYCNETEALNLFSDPMPYFKNVLTPQKIHISLAYQKRSNSWTDLMVVAQTALVLVSPAVRRRLCRPVLEAALQAAQKELPLAVVCRSPMLGSNESVKLHESLEVPGALLASAHDSQPISRQRSLPM